MTIEMNLALAFAIIQMNEEAKPDLLFIAESKEWDKLLKAAEAFLAILS